MKILLLFLITHAESSIKILQNISECYYLFNEEYASLYLNQYFSGDSLNYTITSSTSSEALLNLTNSLTLPLKLQNSLSGISPPPKTTLIEPLCQYYERYCEKLFYCTETTLIIFSFDPTTTEALIQNEVSFDNPIEHYYYIQTNQNYIIFVVTRNYTDQKNIFYTVNFDTDSSGNLNFKNFSSIFFTDFMADLKVTGLSSLLFSLNLGIAGFFEGLGYVVVINLMDFSEASRITIAWDFGFNKILLTANNDNIFALIQNENRIIKLFLDENITISVQDSLYIPELNFKAFSFTFNKKLVNYITEEKLLIGSISRAIIVSTDFSQVFIKNLTNTEAQVFCTSTNENYFFLVNQNNNFTIHFIQENLEEQFFYNLEDSNMSTMAWLASNYYSQEYFVIVLQKRTLNFLSISNEPAQLNFTSGKETCSYNLTVTDRFGNFLTSGFSVNPILEMEESIPLTDNNPLVVSFDDLQAQVVFNITDYFGGSNFENITLEINDKMFKENFEYSLSHYELFYENQTLELYQHLYERIVLLNEEEFLLFNSSTILYFKTNSSIVKPFKNFKILDIQINENFETQEIMIYCKDSHFGVNFLTELEGSFNCPNNLNSSCLQVKSSFPFIGCNNGKSILIFKYIDKISVHITQTQNFTPSSDFIEDFCILNGNIIAVNSSGFILMYNLDSLSLKPLPPVMVKFIGLHPRHIVANESFYYVYFEEGLVRVYDSSVNYIKTAVVVDGKKFVGLDNFLVSVSFNSSLKIMDLQGFLIHSNVFKECDGKILDFDAKFNSLAVLKEDFLIIRKINFKFNEVTVDFAIKDNSSFSEISYRINASIMVNEKASDEKSPVVNFVEFVMMINGQTIFLNKSEVKQIDKHLKLDCEDTVRIPLDQVFLGQNIEVAATGQKSIGEILPRLHEGFHKKSDFNITNIIFVQDVSIFIATVYPNIILLVDQNFTKVLMNKTIDENDYFCEVLSIAAVYVYESLEFVAGVECLYTGQKTSSLIEYHLFFIEFIRSNYMEWLGSSRQSLNIKPSLIKTSLMISGDFVVVITTKYSDIDTLGYYSNIIVICSGSLKFGVISVFCLHQLTPVSFSLSSMYIVDMDLLFYPLQKVYYIYLLELSGSLFIIECLKPIEVVGISTFSLPSASKDFPVSIARCGQYLYIAFNSNLVLVYFLLNFKNPAYDKAIGPIGVDFNTNPGSLECSDQGLAKYLLLTMYKKELCCYLQVIDTTANELASIIKQEYFSLNTFIDNSVFFSAFNSPESLFLLTPENFTIFTVQDFVMTLSPKSCKRSEKVNFTVMASNTVGFSQKVNFLVHLSKNYSSGSVSINIPPKWLIVLLTLATLVLLTGLYFTTRVLCCKKAKTIQPSSELFNYGSIEANFDLR